ncbi:MAG: hypothetical protein ACI35O_06075 [Bacillaceae bacterium]
MNRNEKSDQVYKNPVFGVNFHDFIQRESSSTHVELAGEFGLTVKDVKNLKKKLGRS